ncbi:hypothetical protein AYI68_g1314 [Smittium mucronatum]|uniref:Uncharacterized protein n=1 Tax=Smittium mucronatum TaxID=133383 RepID=A0A1R0H5R0_9FUNG|nr:hypothetical protein AYI68_g1314 [Smittium mucronatum]
MIYGNNDTVTFNRNAGINPLKPSINLPSPYSILSRSRSAFMSTNHVIKILNVPQTKAIITVPISEI